MEEAQEATQGTVIGTEIGIEISHERGTGTDQEIRKGREKERKKIEGDLPPAVKRSEEGALKDLIADHRSPQERVKGRETHHQSRTSKSKRELTFLL